MPLVERSEAGSWAGGVRAGQPKSASGANPPDRRNLGGEQIRRRDQIYLVWIGGIAVGGFLEDISRAKTVERKRGKKVMSSLGVDHIDGRAKSSRDLACDVW